MRGLSWFVLVGVIFLALVALGWFSPFGWGRSPVNYGTAPGPWVWGGLGFPFMGLGMFIFCILMMGSMMLHGHPHIYSAPGRWDSRPRESVSDILERRYSQGEITKDEFDEMKQALSVSDAGSGNEHARH